MTDTTPKFDPIPRLQEIATIIKESGADIFYAPTTVAYDIECAIKEIERLRRDYSCICNEMRRMMEERDEARREILESLHPDLRESYAAAREWDCFNTPKGKLDKTLNGVIIDGGKAAPPKYEDLSYE